MLEYPRDYEEAKVIIKNSVNGPVSKHYKKLNLLRSSLITLLLADNNIFDETFI